MQATIQRHKQLFKGFSEYLGAWCLAGLIGGVSAPVFASGKTEAFYEFAYQVIGGVVIGALISIAYTIFQNKYNPARKRSISVFVAVGLWLITRYAVVNFYLEQQ